MSFGGGGTSGGEVTTAKGKKLKHTGGRSTDAGGRTETYYRRHDPKAPGPGSPPGNPNSAGGGTEGPPTTKEAFKYHAWDKHSTGEKVGRAVIGAVMPGGYLLQGLMAKSQASRDVAGTEGSFDYDYPTGGAAPRPHPDDDNAPAVVAPKKKKSVVTTGVKRTAAAKTPAPKGVTPKKIAPSLSPSRSVSAPNKTRGAGTTGRASTILTPYGELASAEVDPKSIRKKALLGA